jgi:hypothetical protein
MSTAVNTRIDHEGATGHEGFHKEGPSDSLEHGRFRVTSTAINMLAKTRCWCGMASSARSYHALVASLPTHSLFLSASSVAGLAFSSVQAAMLTPAADGRGCAWAASPQSRFAVTLLAGGRRAGGRRAAGTKLCPPISRTGRSAALSRNRLRHHLLQPAPQPHRLGPHRQSGLDIRLDKHAAQGRHTFGGR